MARKYLKEINGLNKFCKWIKERGLKHAAVTNAPRYNAELMISILGLSDFFPFIVSGEECGRAKPFPDPYLKALSELDASPDHTLVFEVGFFNSVFLFHCCFCLSINFICIYLACLNELMTHYVLNCEGVNLS